MLIDDWLVREQFKKTPTGLTQLQHSGKEFDELVVGGWLHIEHMQGRIWYVGAGETKLYIYVNADGTGVEKITVGDLGELELPETT